MSQTLETATSIIRVDLPAVKRNVERIRRHIGPDTEIMYVAKSNGYGTAPDWPCPGGAPGALALCAPGSAQSGG
ncbi:MAG: hypothetical protein HFF77_07350 [Oscillospiraceae bacterium]|nr:hypothetical protein [Oscillospiraceae bacterium]